MDDKRDRLEEVIRQMEVPEQFWSKPEKAQAFGKERVQLEEALTSFDRLQGQLVDAQDLLTLVVEENDEPALQEVIQEINAIKEIAGLEFARMFSRRHLRCRCCKHVATAHGPTMRPVAGVLRSTASWRLAETVSCKQAGKHAALRRLGETLRLAAQLRGSRTGSTRSISSRRAPTGTWCVHVLAARASPTQSRPAALDRLEVSNPTGPR